MKRFAAGNVGSVYCRETVHQSAQRCPRAPWLESSPPCARSFFAVRRWRSCAAEPFTRMIFRLQTRASSRTRIRAGRPRRRPIRRGQASSCEPPPAGRYSTLRAGSLRSCARASAHARSSGEVSRWRSRSVRAAQALEPRRSQAALQSPLEQQMRTIKRSFGGAQLASATAVEPPAARRSVGETIAT
jgi:hypothetical protein